MHLGIRLATVPTCLAAQPAPVAVRVAPADLVSGQAAPIADVHLAQAGVEHGLQPGRGCHDLGRLTRPVEVTRVERVDVKSREPHRQRSGLDATGLVQAGAALTLPAALAVPLGLAVAGNEHANHGAII